VNRYDFISLTALLVLVIALPLYAINEPQRLEQAKTHLRQQFIADASAMYLEICAGCHGAGGEGLGHMPPLNNPELVKADYDVLYKTIARASHGTAMAAWHIDEGGILSDYQIEELIALIRYADWGQVNMLATAQGFSPPTPPAPSLEVVSLAGAANPQASPHECRACHDEPALHTNRFGLDCARCHSMEGWLPARLTRHTFRLDHGGGGNLACQTCHPETYSEHTCYQCHDHQPVEMEQLHVDAGIPEFDACAACHPTGLGAEADSLTASYRQ
jgi:mono/diheme cytochrome c family protein